MINPQTCIFVCIIDNESKEKTGGQPYAIHLTAHTLAHDCCELDFQVRVVVPAHHTGAVCHRRSGLFSGLAAPKRNARDGDLVCADQPCDTKLDRDDPKENPV